ncbi:BrnA antitoxin family protein [Roseofilum sp. BLCC_M154]|uniref:BrnA antitoxin family protein n=1 Tax=Roseofilum acuticapitatum BLCC-M154 TaxID=3022444 RepID=A0ABT7AXY1_9CYAN|nr:BrnA antitoxin family protein [Roseofilum acuticapitatum]MDJ1171767.1 BrnA antitoxin family protein [Roseofilum acuticapitatum BLCC-M154]
MKNKVISSNSQTDWQRLDRMTDDEIDFSDCPELTPELFAKAVVRKKSSDSREQFTVILSIDKDILEWLQSQEQEYQTQINRLLRDYMEKHL